MSARYDLLAVIRGDSVENLVGRLMPDKSGQYGVAGLRVVAAHPHRTYHLLHLPTGARMVITDRPAFASVDVVTARNRKGGKGWPGADLPLSDPEQEAVHLAGALSPAMERLLAGFGCTHRYRRPGRAMEPVALDGGALATMGLQPSLVDGVATAT
jgi:hypothetical protein